jgi:hypothetical protein
LGAGKVFGVYDQFNILSAAALIVQYRNRSILLASASNEEGKRNSAMYYLLDRYFAAHAGENLTFDFEGSNIGSIAYFFSGFGSKATEYQRIKVNRLPFLLRLLKS